MMLMIIFTVISSTQYNKAIRQSRFIVVVITVSVLAVTPTLNNPAAFPQITWTYTAIYWRIICSTSTLIKPVIHHFCVSFMQWSINVYHILYHFIFFGVAIYITLLNYSCLMFLLGIKNNWKKKRTVNLQRQTVLQIILWKAQVVIIETLIHSLS